MQKKRASVLKRSQVEELLSIYPLRLLQTLHDVARGQKKEIYLTGGALRDWLRGESPQDLDFTVSGDSAGFLKQVRQNLGRGTLVALGERHDDTCRLVLQDLILDVSGFRHGSKYIDDDLKKRDFTVNALGVGLDELLGDADEITIIDPLGGMADMRQGVLRACPGAFIDDPLRMVRAFRFSALLDYRIDQTARRQIAAVSHLIARSAAERIHTECDRLMGSSRASLAVSGMAEVGLLQHIAPELLEGSGIAQPAFHHLDVLQHNLLTLECVERVIAEPAAFFPECPETIVRYVSDRTNLVLLKWAALFHDVGKPVCKGRAAEKSGRITFYGHDEEGGRLFLAFAERLRWRRHHRQRVAALISMHMHPFHLLNVRRKDGKLSRKARLKICRRAGEELPGLFLLAMADSLAGQGVDKPEGMEEDLAGLYCRLDNLYRESVRPVMQGPKLLTGRDLIDTVGLVPGPQFARILEALEDAVIEGKVVTRSEAFEWVRGYLGADEQEKKGPESAGWQGS